MKLKCRMLMCLAVSFMLTKSSVAQKDTSSKTVFGVFLNVPIEFPFIEDNALNDRLAFLGFPKSKQPTANLGLGLQFFSGKFITSFSFNKMTKRSKAEQYNTEVEYRSTSLSFGYDLLAHPNVSLYPYVGFKGSGINYVFKEKAGNATSFNNYFQTTLNHKEITNSRAHLDLGVGASQQAIFSLVNLRFGYLLPMEKSRWIINKDDELTDIPPISYKYYFTITLGLGRMIDTDE